MSNTLQKDTKNVLRNGRTVVQSVGYAILLF